jgi:hypothetical protein
MGWNRVVTLEIVDQNRHVRRIASTRDAALRLLRDWPKKAGYYYIRAVNGCAKALRGELDDDDARFYLIDAAKDAALNVQVSLGPSVLTEFEYEIAAVCDELAFEIGERPAT